MSGITPEKLAKAIEDAGLTPAGLALAIGRDKDYIRDYLVGRKRSLKADDLMRIAEKVSGIEESLTLREVPIKNDLQELPVVGTIRAGAWIETFMLDDEDQGTIPVARDRRFPFARQYALAVSGDSMDKKAPDGSYVVCVDFAESGLRLKPGMIAHVESVEVDKSETTLKEIAFENGEVILKPRSSNSNYKPITMGKQNGVEVFVRGIVLSVYTPQKL